MDFQIISLFIVTVINTFFSFFVLRGGKNITRILFSFIALAVSIWSLNLALFLSTNDLKYSLIFANVYYVVAASIPLLFFYFSLFFLKKDRTFNKKDLLYAIPFILLIIFIIINPNFILKDISLTDSGKEILLNKNIYILYISYFLFFIFYSYLYLLKTYRDTKIAVEKIQLKFIFWGTITSFLLGMYTDLFLPLYDDYSLIWLGPLFTLIMVLSIGYAIIRYHLFDVKVFLTELLTFIVWAALLVKIVFAENIREQILDMGLFVVVVIFGILIMQSVKKEIKTREHIEKLAEELSEANEYLKQLDQQKSEFVSIASHQLRTPLTAIKGYSSMILEGSFGEISKKAEGAIAKILESSNRLAIIITDFLDVTKIEQGRMSYRFETVDVKELVHEVVHQMRPTLTRAGLKIKVTDDDQVIYNATADSGKIKQVLFNMIDNAIKYTPKGSIKIFISKNKEGNKIKVAITDTGIGLSEDGIEKLFKKFGRGEDAKASFTNGSGIGLYIAKKMIKAHKGYIGVTSPGKGKGSTFYIELLAE